MVSSKERLRIDSQFRAMQNRLNLQRYAITRLVAMNTIAAGALMEIVEYADGTVQEDAQECARLATEALERIKALTQDAAAGVPMGEDTNDEPEPQTGDNKGGTE